MAAAGALVQFGRSCCAIKAGRDKIVVKIREGGDGYVSEARDEDVLVFVLPDWQILGIWGEKIENLREKEELIIKCSNRVLFLNAFIYFENVTKEQSYLFYYNFVT